MYVCMYVYVCIQVPTSNAILHAKMFIIIVVGTIVKTIDGIQVQLPQVDTSLPGKPGFKKKTVSAATRIYEFVKQKDNKELLYLARGDLEDDIWKWERKTAAKQSQASASSKDCKDIPNANNCPPKKQQRKICQSVL